MPQRNSSGRGGTAAATRNRPGNQTPNTPTVSESEVSRMRVDEIRGRLRQHGVSGVSGLRKAELVKTLVKTLRAEQRKGGAAKKIAGPTGRAIGAKKSTGPTPRTGGAAVGGGARSGRGSSKSLKYAQEISSPEDRPERRGRSLVTTNHEVIQRWARARKAKPATIAGTEREGRAGVLTFNFPGYKESERLRQITWDEWFRTFDERRLNLIYQEELRDGRQSNFFRTESPDREGG